MRPAGWLWLAALASPAAAFPEGAPWDRAAREGCAACHFGQPVREADPALRLALPESVSAGRAYRVTVRLAVPDRGRGGFMLSAGAGRFAARDGRTEANGALARNTEAGSMPAAGEMTWVVEWRAPDRLDGPIAFELWANAANGDDSRLGDQTYRLRRTVAPAP